MPLPDHLNDRQHQAHREPAGRPGEVAMAVVGPDGGSIGGTGGTSMLDDSGFTPGGSSVTPAGFLADDTATDPIDEGDIGVVRMNPTTRILYVQLKDSSGADVSVGGGTQYDEDTAAANAEKLTMAGVVRKDTAATLVSADGDRTELIVDSAGRLHVNASGAGSFATGQVSIGASATQIAASRATRRRMTIVNHGSTAVFVGASGVATNSGLRLIGLDGAAVSLVVTGAVYGIVASGSQTVSYIEEYD